MFNSRTQQNIEAMSLNVVILAAGQGTRMHSEVPKVLHKLGGRPMLAHCIDTARQLDAAQIMVIHGYAGERVRASINDDEIVWLEQAEQLGTGHAVQQAESQLNKNTDSKTLILYADVPLVQAATLHQLLDSAAACCVLTCVLDNPSGYGRIVRNQQQQVMSIVEEKDADPHQRKIREINTGIISADTQHLLTWLKRLNNNNAQQEYYLTDCIAMAVEENVPVEAVMCAHAAEVSGINNRIQLAQAEAYYQQRERESLMRHGVTLKDPATTYIEGIVEVAADTEIEPSVSLRGAVKLAKNVRIGMNSVIIDSTIAAGTIIHPNSHIENASIGAHCEIGPFARIRAQTELADQVKIGNFVETKKTSIGQASKVNHLSYVGDAQIGAHSNIGAGTICCNYDGANKHQTIIGDNVFIGSDSQLVAPVSIHDGATIGAGSTITEDAPAHKLTLSRSKQATVDHWQRPKKNK